MILLGLDYGAKTVGVAVSDALGLGATGVEIIRREKENHLRKTLSRIEELVREYKAEAIVVGHPVNMDGSVGERAEAAEAFAEMIGKRIDLPLYLCDERLTSIEAEEIMRLNGVPRKDYKKYVDMIAAQVILEDWMNNHTDENN